MILFLLKSSLCLGVILLFYKLILEDVAIHKFKRGYLIFGLVLSLIIPMLPTGYSLSRTEIEKEATILLFEELAQNSENSAVNYMTIGTDMLLYFILIIALIFLVNAGRNIFTLVKKASSNENLKHGGLRLVLIEEKVPPHTFLNKIYINKQDFLEGRIDDQLLAHESAHAEQAHSLDIILIELFICIFWFNPILRYYKQAIQLNHEFLADEAVVNKYHKVKKYQVLLLDFINSNNQISLASNINFHLTKKRLEMMTKNSTAMQKTWLPLTVLPLILVLLMAFGSPIVAQNSQKEMEQNTVDYAAKARDAYFKDAIIHYTANDGKIMVKSYSALPYHVKNLIAPPPPPPPVIEGTRNPPKTQPLKKGTVVTLTEGGSIRIGGNGNVAPPPPPKAPKFPNGTIQSTGNDALSPPPPPPLPPKEPKRNGNNMMPQSPPPPPPPPQKLSDLEKQGVKIYLNGIQVKSDVAESIKEKLDSRNMKIKTEADGTKSLYITTKDKLKKE